MRRLTISLVALMATLACSAALACGAAATPSPGEANKKPIEALIQAAHRGLDSALGALVLAATPQAALPPKKVTARDRAAATPTQSTPVRRPTRHDSASMPAASAGTNGSFKPPSVAALQKASTSAVAQVTHTPPDHVAVLLGSSAVAPAGAPPAVRNAVDAANTIVGQPYVWGGGHASFYSHGYDCSGAVSFALAGGGFLQAPLNSGQLAQWGAPGPGKWITVYANGSHTYAVIAGLRWDTVGDAKGTGPRWHVALPYPEGFVARHPPGY
jgi:cell wall-associated NlpC family hydrolase